MMRKQKELLRDMAYTTYDIMKWGDDPVLNYKEICLYREAVEELGELAAAAIIDRIEWVIAKQNFDNLEFLFMDKNEFWEVTRTGKTFENEKFWDFKTENNLWSFGKEGE